jgi:hypothetical protein
MHLVHAPVVVKAAHAAGTSMQTPSKKNWRLLQLMLWKQDWLTQMYPLEQLIQAPLEGLYQSQAGLTFTQTSYFLLSQKPVSQAKILLLTVQSPKMVTRYPCAQNWHRPLGW